MSTPPATTAAKVQPYNKSELADMYGVSVKVLNAWLIDVAGLGEYRGRCFTIEQVNKIFAHCGAPS